MRSARCSRRDFLKAGLIGGGVLWARGLRIGPPWEDVAYPLPTEAKAWAGESLAFRLDCPIMPSFSEGELALQRVRASSRFLATMRVRFLGVSGVLTAQRQDLFASLMEWSEADRRLLPVWYAEQVSHTGNWKRKVLVFYHLDGKYVEHKIYPHRYRKMSHKTQGRILDDPLSAFYNWRVGAFGPLRLGQTYVIDNLARNDPFVLRLRMASEEENRRRRAVDPQPDHKAYLLRAQLDREVFSGIQGEVEVWLDNRWRPVSMKATGVKLLGEVRGYIVRRAFLPQPELDTSPPPPLERAFWDMEARRPT